MSNNEQIEILESAVLEIANGKRKASHIPLEALMQTIALAKKRMDVLARIAQWDMLDAAADGKYWREEIAKVT